LIQLTSSLFFRGRVSVLSIVALLLSAAPDLYAQATRPAATSNVAPPRVITAAQRELRETYTKFEHMIPMRDGVKAVRRGLRAQGRFAEIPHFCSPARRMAASLTVKTSTLSLAARFKYYAKEKFIFVLADVRGRYASEGEFVHMRPQIDVKSGPKDIDESTDTYDTIDWLIKHIPNNNGNVGMMGISYPGF